MANIINMKNKIQILIDNNKKKYFIKVPTSIIEDTSMSGERVAVYCYLYSNVGINNRLLLSLPDLFDFLNIKWDNNVYKKNRWNKNPIKLILDKFRDIGLIEYQTDDNELICSSTKFTEIRFYKDYTECNDDYFETKQFAKIYLDELEIIMSKKNNDYAESINAKTGETIMESHTIINLSELLLVFSWLRTKIHINNEKDSFGEKRAEALSCYLKDIANAVEIDKDDISTIIALLVKLGLIYCNYGDYTIMNFDGIKRPKQVEHIITNTYKRVEDKMIYSGKNYYLSQVEKKKSELRKIKSKKSKS